MIIGNGIVKSIYNLTLHRMTREQLDSLEVMFPHARIHETPIGTHHRSQASRIAWVERIFELYVSDTGRTYSTVAAVIGGDTAAFMLLMARLTIHDISSGTPIPKRWLCAHSDRNRTHVDSYWFNFRFWVWF